MTTPSVDVPTIQPVPQLPQYRWNAAAGQYIAPSGRFVPRELVREQLDLFIVSVTDDMALASSRLVAGELTLAQWQTTMMQLSKEVNLAGGALERGGWYQLTQADFGRVGATVREEYKFLRQFAAQVESGAQRLDGTLPRRARLYGQRGRMTYHDFSRVRARESGFDEERSVLNPADHCEECVDQAARSWQALGTMVPVGQRQCRSNCRCHVVYRNSTTGETRVA